MVQYRPYGRFVLVSSLNHFLLGCLKFEVWTAPGTPLLKHDLPRFPWASTTTLYCRSSRGCPTAGPGRRRARKTVSPSTCVTFLIFTSPTTSKQVIGLHTVIATDSDVEKNFTGYRRPGKIYEFLLYFNFSRIQLIHITTSDIRYNPSPRHGLVYSIFTCFTVINGTP